MDKKFWIGFAYVSISIVLWGTIGSIIDYPLLQKNVYEAGSLAQFLTFFLTGTVISILAIQIFKKLSEK